MQLTLDGVEEILHRMLVQPQGLLVILGFILLCGFCHQINGFLERPSKQLRAPQQVWKARGKG